ncbi:FGGY family carbohydrate kinase, partial [Escherichia coli]|nr:FGGY family carbohydrate kinase [Escherichia coli]
MGIDLGTSEVKALLTDDESHTLATGRARLEVENPHPHWSEQSPQAWWHATLDAVTQVRTSNPAGFSALRGIGLS